MTKLESEIRKELLQYPLPIAVYLGAGSTQDLAKRLVNVLRQRDLEISLMRYNMISLGQRALERGFV